MFAAERRRVAGTEAGRLFGELELKFDLMRLRNLEARLGREETRLVEEETLLREGLRRPGAPARKGVTRCRVWWVGVRRGMLVERRRQLSLLEDEIRFAMRVRRLRASR